MDLSCIARNGIVFKTPRFSKSSNKFISNFWRTTKPDSQNGLYFQYQLVFAMINPVHTHQTEFFGYGYASGYQIVYVDYGEGPVRERKHGQPIYILERPLCYGIWRMGTYIMHPGIFSRVTRRLFIQEFPTPSSRIHQSQTMTRCRFGVVWHSFCETRVPTTTENKFTPRCVCHSSLGVVLFCV